MNYSSACFQRRTAYLLADEIIHGKTDSTRIRNTNRLVKLAITDEIYKYDLNYKVLIEMMNTIKYSKTPDEKISCITTLVKQINLELNNNITADNLLDILSYILIHSNIDNPYDELIYMDEYSTNNSDLNAYTLVSFNAVIDYVQSL